MPANRPGDNTRQPRKADVFEPLRSAHDDQQQPRPTLPAQVRTAQIVEVGGYTYRWDGDIPLQVGDLVMLPENWVSKTKHGPGPFTAVVTQLGSTYDGDMASVLSLVATRTP